METALGRAVAVTLSLTFTAPLGAIAANSGPYSFDTCSVQKQCRLLSHAELERLRGGLSYMGANSELQFTFGITQVVYVNNEMVALTQLLLPSVNQALGAGMPSASQLQTLNSALPSAQATPPPSSASAAPTVGAGSSTAPGAPANIAPAPTSQASPAKATVPTTMAANTTQTAPSPSTVSAASPAQATVPTTMAANTTQTAPSPSTVSAANGSTAPTVLVNAVQATRTNPVVVNVPTADQLRALVVQIGAGNSVPNAADLRAATMATVIQNTQDNQTIRTVTMFNVSVAVSAAMRLRNIANAVSNSLR